MKPLSLYETRVIGALIEKSLTTPEQYPLSLNALTSACNQKSNREPVLELAEATVKETVEGLIEAGLVRDVSSFNSRTSKYQHRFCNTEFSELQLTAQQLGIVCVLLLRGAQTPGELRSRTQRLCEFRDVQEVEIVLHRMMQHEYGPLVKRLEREPGKRESRYAHLFGAEADASEAPVALSTRGAETQPVGDTGVQALEARVAQLEQQMAQVQELLDELMR